MESFQETAVAEPRHRRLWFMLGAGSMLSVVLIVKTLSPSPQGFGSLEDLVTELVAAIEARDESRIDDLCYHSLDVPIDRLVKQHEKLNYLALLREKRGWKSADSWTLGGHGQRFGHINVDFVKQLDGKWYLTRIWGCR